MARSHVGDRHRFAVPSRPCHRGRDEHHGSDQRAHRVKSGLYAGRRDAQRGAELNTGALRYADTVATSLDKDKLHDVLDQAVIVIDERDLERSRRDPRVREHARTRRAAPS